MFHDTYEVLTNFYGSDIKPTPAQIKLRDKKLAAAIAYLGDKYRLAKPMGKLKHGQRR